MAFEGALAGLIEQREKNQRYGLGQLQEVGALSSLLAQLQQRQETEKVRDILSSDLPEPEKIKALSRTPGGIVILQKLAEIQKKEQPVFAPAGSVPYVGGVPQPQIPFKPEAFSLSPGQTRFEGGVPTASVPDKPSPLTNLIAERNALPPNDPRRIIYDQAITKLSTHQPPINVYSGSLTPALDEQGKPIFVQPSGRPDIPPRVAPGIRPMPTP